LEINTFVRKRGREKQRKTAAERRDNSENSALIANCVGTFVAPKRTGKEKQTCLCLIVICHIAIPKIGI
jgi:hypothetical protein